MSSLYEFVCGAAADSSNHHPMLLNSPHRFQQRLSKRRHRHSNRAEGEPLLSNRRQPAAQTSKTSSIKCRLCLTQSSQIEALRNSCGHKFCSECLFMLVRHSISESRVMMECPLPECDQQIHPSDIYRILRFQPDEGAQFALKYEQFMVRRVLQSVHETRWCPAPDCNYAVIGSPRCPRIKCQLCGLSFCFFCKQQWHPGSVCEQQNSYEHPPILRRRRKKTAENASVMKRCPKCSVPIMKMEDGSCNHMTCSMCSTEFCWLCNKVISDLHFLSPTGCTFWGRKRWSRRKKIIWQCMALLGAPVAFVVLACVSVPTIIIGLPFFTARKVYKKLRKSRFRPCLVTATAFGAAVASPAIALVAVAVCVPVMLTYTYGIIPILLFRRSSESTITDPDPDLDEYSKSVVDDNAAPAKDDDKRRIKLDVKDASATVDNNDNNDKDNLGSASCQLPVGSFDSLAFVEERTASADSLSSKTAYESCIRD